MPVALSPLILKETIDMRRDVLAQLRIDPGLRTLGELLQDREAAAFEIEELRSEITRVRAGSSTRTSQYAMKEEPPQPIATTKARGFRAGTLIRLKEVCELLGISRSTVYKRLADKTFPAPVRLGPRTVRWHVDAIEAWRDTL
jgi:prophage regulatory protein